jgi:hypothetical protein
MKILIAFAISAMMIPPVLADECVERVRFSQGWDLFISFLLQYCTKQLNRKDKYRPLALCYKSSSKFCQRIGGLCS